MVWMANQQIGGSGNRNRVWGASFLCWVFLMLVTPKISLSPKKPLFADMRNFLGVPNTLNVITNFPFLIVGVLGFVLSLGGSFFKISLRGELWGWVLFYAGISGMAFGSAYYHLKPDESRVMWDILPMMIAYSSLFSSLITERLGERISLGCLLSLLTFAVICIIYARAFNDLRMCVAYQLIPCVAIPVMAFLFPPKYSHSRYWLWAAGAHFLAKVEALADMKIYNASHFIISGHSLDHLCSAIAPVLLSVMLMNRSMRLQRLGDLKGCP